MRYLPSLPILTALAAALLTSTLTTNAYSQYVVSYEIRRGTSSDFEASELVAITTDTKFLDTTANTDGESYHYFLRAVPGREASIRYFGGIVPAKVYSPMTSSEAVPDLVYFTQSSTFSPTFYLVENDAPEESTLIWPETEALETEDLTNQLPGIAFLLRFVFDKRLSTADSDGTAELVAYDPFTESVLSELGPVGTSTAVDWSADLNLTNSAQGVALEWTSYTNRDANSLIVSVETIRDIPDPVAPEDLTVSATPPAIVTLVWTENPTAVTYNVYRSTSPDFSTATQIATGLVSPQFTDTTAEAGETYYYWTTSQNATGESSPLQSVTVVVPPEVFTLWVRSGFGDITRTPEQDYYSPGDTVTLSVSPDSGYAFESWDTGDETITETEIEIIVEENTVVVANYTLDAPQAYVDWITELAESDSLYLIGPDRDVDADGLTNIFEYALGTDSPDSGSDPDYDSIVLLTPETAAFSIYANPDEKLGRVWVETSADLETWVSSELRFENGTWLLDVAEGSGLAFEATPATGSPVLWKLWFELTVKQPDLTHRFLRLGADYQ